MPSKQFKFNIPLLIFVILFAVLMIIFQVAATSLTLYDGNITVSDTGNKLSNSNGTLTATAKGSLFSKATNTVTVTNSSNSKAKITFNYTVSSANSFTIDGASASNSGTYTNTLEPNGTVTLYIQSKSGLSGTTVTLTMSNFTFVAAAASSNVTFDYDSTYGSITVADAAVADGGVVNISSSGAALVATPKSGSTFLGWIDGDGIRLSESANYTLTPAEDMTVTAVFASASSKAWFVIDGAKWTNDLNIATSLGSTIVLAHSGTLPADNYTIPAGVTLLIPYDSSNTLCTTAPTIHENDYTTPSVYRTLTMASGASITVNGAISVSGSQSSKFAYNGMPSGPVGFIDMKTGSSITVNNGANLYVWGFITGSGNVTINSGGTVYEGFQVPDYRGGDGTTSITSAADTYHVFPMSQYTLQNVEVPMKLMANSKACGHFSVSVSSTQQKALVPFIGQSNSMFKITEGYLIKDYDEANDRLLLDLHGNISADTCEFSFEADGFLGGLIGGITGNMVNINTSKYILPLNPNMIINICSGTLTSTQDLALLPSTQLIIHSGARMEMLNGKKLILYDLDQWLNQINPNENHWVDGKQQPAKFVQEGSDVMQVKYVGCRKGAPVTRNTASLVDAMLKINGTLDVSSGYIYTSTSGANICSDGGGKLIIGAAGTERTAYQADQGREGNVGSGSVYVDFVPVSITPAKLLNGDSSYTDTAGYSYANVYSYVNGKWVRGPYVAATNIKVTDALDMYFYVRKDALVDGVEYYAVITKSFAEGFAPDKGNYTPGEYTFTNNTSKATIKRGDWEDVGDYYRFPFSDISAKEMCDEITVALYDPRDQGDQTTFPPLYEKGGFSVQKYATSALKILDDTAENEKKHKTALVDMLNYGAAAQIYYDYGVSYTDGKVDISTLADYDKDSNSRYGSFEIPEIANDEKDGNEGNSGCNWTNGTVTDSAGIKIDLSGTNWGSRLMLINRFGMHFTAYGLADKMTATVTISRTDAEGNTTVVNLAENLEAQKGNDGSGNALYYFAIEGTAALNITDARNIVTITINNGTAPFCTITDSVSHYVSRMLNDAANYGIDGDGKFNLLEEGLKTTKLEELKTMLRALIQFSDSATDALTLEDLEEKLP